MSTRKRKADGTVDQRKKEIDILLSVARGDKINIACALCDLIRRAPEKDRAALFRYTAEVFDFAESNEQIAVDCVIADNEAKQLEQRYGTTVDSMLEAVIAENPSEDVFYKRMWDLVNNPFFGSRKARTFALYYLLIDRRIPYFRVAEGLKMSNDDFKSRMRELRGKCARVRFILSREFEQKTEQTDLVLRELKDLDESNKAVLMAYVVAMLRSTERNRELAMLERFLRA